MTESDLDKLKKESIWPIYVCENKECMNDTGQRSFQIVMGYTISEAPKTMKCPKCSWLMKISNKPKK